MSNKTAIEFALRSIAIDLLDLSHRLGIGPTTIYADPRSGGYIQFAAWDKDGVTPILHVDRFADEED